MQRNPVLRHSTLALAVAAMLGSAPAWAEYDNTTNPANTYIWDQASVFITGNDDNSAGSEGVFIKSNGAGHAGANFVTGDETNSSGYAQIYAEDNVELLIDSDDGGRGTFYLTDRNGNQAAVNTLVSDAQTTTVNAANAAGTVTSTLTVGTNGITLDSTVNGANGTNTLTGTTSINASANFATTINTGTSTGNVTVGNANNTTSLNSATNNVGVASYATTNRIGTGTGASTNAIGNTNVATTVTASAGNSRLSLENDRGSMAVTGMASGLSTPTQTVDGGVVVAETGGVAVDANGALAVGGATGPTTAMVMENGYGQVNGLVVTETQATVSGGAGNSSSLTLSDRNARFSNAATGRPITVTGVADGEDDFDAVNVRQFAGAIASVTAQANIPALASGQNLNLGVGLGHFMGKSGMALGMNWRVADNALVKATVSSGLNSGSEAAVGVGASIGW